VKNEYLTRTGITSRPAALLKTFSFRGRDTAFTGEGKELKKSCHPFAIGG
jgi:hypothetical protein